MSQESVAIRRCNSDDELLSAIDDLAQETGLSIPAGSHVVIKPNLNDLMGPDSGVTTDVKVVNALVRYLNAKSRPDQILIVESDSWNRLAEEAFKQLGYRELESYDNVKLVNLTRAKTLLVETPLPCYYSRLRIPRLFMENDFFISVAKLRTHHTMISCILKNQFGCIPGRFKGKYHAYLDEILANLNILLRPDWSLIDGLIALDHNRPRDVGLLLASSDPVALDSVSAKLLGLDPRKISHIKAAAKSKVGRIDAPRILYQGNLVTDLSPIIGKKFVAPTRFTRTVRNLEYGLVRTADKARSFASSLERLAALSTGAAAYSKTEVLRRIIDWRRLSSTYRALVVRRPQDDA